jgi:hypothetical protein
MEDRHCLAPKGSQEDGFFTVDKEPNNTVPNCDSRRSRRIYAEIDTAAASSASFSMHVLVFLFSVGCGGGFRVQRYLLSFYSIVVLAKLHEEA